MQLKAFPLLIATLGASTAPSIYASDANSTEARWTRAEKRAAATVKQMTAEEKTVLTHGIMPLPVGPNPPPIPADAIPGAGYVAGIERLGVPALKESDASLGVAYVFGLRKDGATALPSGLAMASTWNPELLREGGRMIGSEARAKGFNVLLAGGVNLMRDPRNGRNFEYFGEDPWLAGTLAGASIAGVQSNDIISTIKHFALNGQETGRKFVDVKISESAARESDLLAFQIAIEIGQPGSVMCAYNRVHGQPACGSDWLLNKVLKQDWGYRGFVMSDWGAVANLEAALNGLDQQSGAQLDPQVFFDEPLADAMKKDPAYAARVDDMNKRILTAIYANGLDTHPATPGGTVDLQANAAVAENVARQGIVLLRNERNTLPLSRSIKRIAVIGGYADTGVLSGAGSSQVQGEGGPAVSIPLGGHGPYAPFLTQAYHRSVPLDAIKAAAKKADVRFRDGRYVSEAVTRARQADVAIVFATQWSAEGFDQPDLSLPYGQDALISAVAEANPNTVVVLETGGPILMPWLDHTAAVVQAWYPGARGGEAIAAVLFGDVNPSGRLPITFPASENDLPRTKIDGFDTLDPDFSGSAPSADARLTADYDIEGSDVGYRWNARHGHQALFPFGYGLSYTSFVTSGLKTDGATASFEVKNTGDRLGATVAQLYLVSRLGATKRRLVGYERVELAAGESRKVSLTIDRRLLADWRDGSWQMPAGAYEFALGEHAEALGPPVVANMKARRWKD
ncbi:glycoside hydrolase family 3 C-terminal domain-containing protein [Steroidobacter sp. S1-65]|uniref:Glycoside hydrolase family 3 C-terminal domain-containing protein n=1 Tax=Steroidobacter gossypii TaxID=2805490 RepID=A0ABS1WVB0_9GAMM|nr:glycoside hydrolase family 3 C-terminal domain-containing protein [Steroidobacter gossypii]MBM0104904.1 glycoside hydrolase family 3 C-terminal domain-containing protein [Steroidobacter gossypii]